MQIQPRHGMTDTPTHRSWLEMRRRCTNPHSEHWPDYGGRGIRFCERWESFENFLADMGERPDGMTLDRIDVNGHYEPGNCRWATSSVQQRNKRRIVLEDHERIQVAWLARDLGYTQREIAEFFGISQGTVHNIAHDTAISTAAG